MLICNDVTKKYMNITAVEDVSLELGEGKIYALLGPNGSGKTTLMKMIAGLAKPSQGEILFNGKVLDAGAREHIAYMPTENYFYSYMTCRDLGKYYEDFFMDFSMDMYLAKLAEMELDPDMKLSKLSSGMIAKCKVAVTLSRNSSLIMLDEPLNGIDIIARDRIVQTIIASMDEHKAIIISSHLVDELEKIVDGAIFMQHGKVVLAGDAEYLRESEGKSLVDLYRSIYG